MAEGRVWERGEGKETDRKIGREPGKLTIIETKGEMSIFDELILAKLSMLQKLNERRCM